MVQMRLESGSFGDLMNVLDTLQQSTRYLTITCAGLEQQYLPRVERSYNDVATICIDVEDRSNVPVRSWETHNLDRSTTLWHGIETDLKSNITAARA
jgi:hypothetical protein